MDLTLSKVVEAARQRRAAVTAEVGGYVVLLALQRLANTPRRISPELIGLTAAGDVELAPSPAAEPRELETALRGLLASLLALSQSAPPALRATSERGSVGDLAAFEAELTAALIPINHAAARRALARVFRDTQKAPRGATGAATTERESSPAPASLRAPESSSPPPVAVRAAVLELRLQSEAPTSVVAALANPTPSSSAAEPPASRAEPAPAELEIDVDVDVLLAEPEPIAAAIVPARTKPITAAVVPARAEPIAAAPAPGRDEQQLEVADVEVDELELLLASEPPPPSVTEPPLSADAAPESGAPASFSLVHGLTPAARALTPRPASVAGAPSEPEPVESPSPDLVPAFAWRGRDAELTLQRSDLRELLDGYLAHTRREEDMTAGLRRMIGLEPWRAKGMGSERTGLGQ